MKKPLYLALASLLQRQRTLADSWLSSPADAGRGRFLTMKSHVEDELARLCRDYLPSGSGFDAGTRLDQAECEVEHRPYPGRLWFDTSFHHMDEWGAYDGWTEHSVVVVPVFGDLCIKVTGRDRNGVKDHIAETFHQVLTAEVEYDEVPQKQE